MIEAVTIAENRYAPDGLKDICMYSIDGGENLTLGQLIAAVCIRMGCCLEAQTIAALNKINGNNSNLDRACECMERLCESDLSDSEWSEMREFFIGALGIAEDAIPAKANAVKERLAVANVLKGKIEELTRASQDDMLDIQSLVNNRDVAFSTSTNLIRSLGITKNNTAQKY